MNAKIIHTLLRGRALLENSLLNKGSAFTEEERKALGLEGLLPSHVSTIEEQLARTYANFKSKATPIEKYIFLTSLYDRNEVLFYRLVQSHITEMLPIIYTPTVGEACQRYSRLFQRARGLYLSYSHKDRISDILRECDRNPSVIVVTDGERILGLGDLGVGGMGIPVGKLALYTLCAGIDPGRTLPIMLDVGTNNPDLLKDPLYIGWRHPRISQQDYDPFMDQVITAIKSRWPHVLLQWEDLAKSNAQRFMHRYADRIASFNDDIQGTAAVILAGLWRACRITGQPLAEQKMMISGAGSAATGIGELLQCLKRQKNPAASSLESPVWLVDTQGLVHEGREDLSDEKKPFAQTLAAVRSVGLDPTRRISLHDAMRRVQPHILLGLSSQPRIFDEALVKSMAAAVERPIIFPLSNPTSQCEASPEDLLRWTHGKALVATGTPFEPVLQDGKNRAIGQCNNAFIFPGVGLGLMVTHAKRVPNTLFLTAAECLAAFDLRSPGFEDSLFPNLENVRELSEKMAQAIARDVLQQGLSDDPFPVEEIPARVKAAMWDPVYPIIQGP